MALPKRLPVHPSCAHSYSRGSRDSALKLQGFPARTSAKISEQVEETSEDEERGYDDRSSDDERTPDPFRLLA